MGAPLARNGWQDKRSKHKWFLSQHGRDSLSLHFSMQDTNKCREPRRQSSNMMSLTWKNHHQYKINESKTKTFIFIQQHYTFLKFFLPLMTLHAHWSHLMCNGLYRCKTTKCFIKYMQCHTCLILKLEIA